MTPDVSIDRLTATDVIEPTDDRDSYRLTPTFVDEVERYRAEFEAAGGSPDQLRERLPDAASFPDGPDGLDPTVVAEYCAVRDRVDDEREAIAVAAVLDRFSDPSPPTDGSPVPFLPIHGERLPFIVGCYGAVVVYAWREDCPPCDIMKATFEAVFDPAPDDLLLVSVYGPDCPRLLDERFDVVGAPTTLFVRDGAVDSRFVGARDRNAVEREIETFRRLSED